MTQMNCNESQAALALWVGNDLEDAHVPVLKAHLAVCATCRAQWQNLQAAQAVLRQVAEQRPHQEITVAAEVAQRIAAQSTVQRRQPDAPSWSVLGAWSGVCAMVVWLTVSTPFAPQAGGDGDWSDFPAIQVETQPVSMQNPWVQVLPQGTVPPQNGPQLLKFPADSALLQPGLHPFNARDPRSL